MESDDIMHYFVNCKSSKTFWDSLFVWWNNLTETNIDLTACDLVFGILNIDDNIFLHLLNVIILRAKWYLYNCKKEKGPLSLDNFIVQLKHGINIEKYIMYANGQEVIFDKIYNILSLE